MFNEEKAKNDQQKHKNDENWGFEELLNDGYDETDDRYVRGKSASRSLDIGCGAFVGAAMQYPFHGRNALNKVTIAALLTLIPVIGSLFVSGYGVRVVRRILRGQRDLPEWNDFIGDFRRGLIVWLGGGIFSILMALSMVAIVTIPIVLLLGFPMIAYSICRYAETDEFAVFFDILGAYRYVLNNFWVSFVFTLNSMLLGLCWGVTIAVGFALFAIGLEIVLNIFSISVTSDVLFAIPALVISAAVTISFTYMMGVWGRTVGIEA